MASAAGRTLRFCSSSEHADLDLDEILAYLDGLPDGPANRILDSRSGPQILSILHGARNQRILLASRFAQ